MAQNVLCEVNSYKNWGKGNKCTADSIYVVSVGNKQPSQIEETGCKTFEASDS
ncbi:DUF1540 domain-containing protein [Bacillus toyonensis]|uniref:DUF1540 domain-containing protein n=1 Tax=Bacillus toyonensis TaxID=155322 RepID=UPI003D2105CB